MRPPFLSSLAFRISWWLRGIPVLLMLGGCATTKVCEFDVHVRVTPNADDECRALGIRFSDWGLGITDSHRILGCARSTDIITNGTESNMGHEMKHQVERNCR